MEAVVHDGADVVQVQSRHVSDPPGGVLESRETHVEVDLVQVSTIEGVQLEKASEGEWVQVLVLIPEIIFKNVSDVPDKCENNGI